MGLSNIIYKGIPIYSDGDLYKNSCTFTCGKCGEVIASVPLSDIQHRSFDYAFTFYDFIAKKRPELIRHMERHLRVVKRTTRLIRRD